MPPWGRLPSLGPNVVDGVGTLGLKEGALYWHQASCPGKALAGAAEVVPARALPGKLVQTPLECATLEPEVSNIINHIGTKAREAPPWWHADLCEDHKHTRLDEDQKTTDLAEEIHETPGKILAGDDSDAAARPLPGAPARP